MKARLAAAFSLLLFFALGFVPPAHSQQIDTTVFGEMQWRNVGPFRGGRTRAVSGVPSLPNVFYVGAVNGGVWKTNDFGRTWRPIFDQEPTGSIGAIEVAPSDPNVIYVGSGEGLHRPDLSVGDGIYKSTDGGATWTHLGLRDGQQISQMAVDPRDPNRLFVAVAGHPYGPNPERGVYRSTDGGASFKKVLFKDDNIGAGDVKIDPSDPNVVYATLWEAREGPWENAEWSGTGGGIYKSTDGGQTWQALAGGLPGGIVQAYVSIARSDPNRLFAVVATAGKVDLYRSNDAGATWSTVTKDSRPKGRIGGGDLPVPMIDPKNPDVVYMTSTVTWKSTDGGLTWSGFRGAPGGDDYQNIWINPNDPNIIAITSDQGAIVSVNGGQTWSSWYNQPTAQIYHVSADNAFPYRLCSGQQESGSVCISSRGTDGEITFRDWHPVAAEEYGYVTADPLDPDIVFGGKLTRYDRRTTQAQNILPVPLGSPNFRVIRTEPVIFSPLDPHLLVLCGKHPVDNARRRTDLEADQSRPHAKDMGNARNRRYLLVRSLGAAEAAWCDLRPCSVAAGHQPHLGGHRRRPYLADNGRRRKLEQHYPAATVGVAEGIHAGGQPLRSADCLRRDQHPAPGRSASSHLSHARFRQDLDGDHHWYPGE